MLRRHDMKFCGVDVNVHEFLTSALDGGEQWASYWSLSVNAGGLLLFRAGQDSVTTMERFLVLSEIDLRSITYYG